MLSPTLFCIYFDKLLGRLDKTGVGCHVGSFSYAAIGYADVIILLSSSISGLQTFVDTADNFASEYGVTKENGMCIFWNK